MWALIAVYTLIVFGILFCFFGRFPGQVLVYAGMLVASFAMNNHAYPIWLLIVCGVLVVASILVNKFIAPKLSAKVHEFGKAGKIGTVVGSIISLFFFAAEMNEWVILIIFFVFPYLFAFVFEAVSQKNAAAAAKRAAGAYTLFVTTTLINLAISIFCAGEVVYGWIE